MSVGIDTAFGSFATTQFRAGVRRRSRTSQPTNAARPEIVDAAWNPTGTSVGVARTQDELTDVRRFRHRVIIEEQGRPLVSSDSRPGELANALDDSSAIWFARERGEIVGTISQTIAGPDFDLSRLPAALELDGFPRSSAYPLSYSGRLAIAATHRSRWVLPSLARHSYAYGRELGGKFDFMSTSPAFVPLFERFGYLRYTATSYHHVGEGGLQIPMVLPATDHAYLRTMRSPCLSAMLHFRDEPEWSAWLRVSHPMIDVYYSSPRCQEDQATALAEWLGIPSDAASELSRSSFVHHFPAGTLMRDVGDRVTSTFLAVNAPLSVQALVVDHDARMSKAEREGLGVAPDGVVRSRVTIRCATDTIVLCVPDSSVARLARRHPTAAGRVERLLWHAGVDDRCRMRIFR